MKVARIYLRVSTKQQDLQRQEVIVDSARAQGYYIAGVYRDKESGTSSDRPELLRMIADLQPGDVVIAESIDRLTRGELADSEKLVETIKATGARLAIPGLVDLSEITESNEGIARIVLDAMQNLLFRIALQQARDDYETRRRRQREGIALAKAKGKYKGRAPDKRMHERIVTLRESGKSISETARLVPCSESWVKIVWAQHKANNSEISSPPLDAGANNA